MSYNGKKLLITGASGFVGGFLVEEAMNRGYEVHAAVRSSSKTKVLDELNASKVIVHFDEPEALSQLLKDQQYDYIIHNAGLTKSPSQDKYNQINASYLKVLIDCIRSADIQLDKLLFVSSLAAYGPADQQEEDVVKDHHTPRPVTMYGKSKLLAETYLKRVKEIPWLIIRPTAVYGPREYDLLTVYQTLAKKLELYVGFGKQELTFIYVKDLVRAMLDLIASDQEYKGYFATDGHIYSAEEMNRIVKNELDTSALPIRLPVVLIRFIAFISEKISSFAGNYPALNVEKVKELGAKSWNCDYTGLSEDINFTPQFDLKKGMKETIAWCKQEDLL